MSNSSLNNLFMPKRTVSSLKKKAWEAFSLYYRQSQADHSGLVICYTCKHAHHWKSIQSGHAIGGRHGGVLFDEEIIRPQCYSCNVGRRGNYQVFITNLINENGLDWWNKKLESSRQVKKWVRSELEELIQTYQAKLSVLERTKKWSNHA